MNAKKVTIELDKDQAIILFDFIAELNCQKKIALVESSARQEVLWLIECLLEKQLSEPFQDNYPEIIALAKQAILNSNKISLAETITKVKKWDYPDQLQFCENIPSLITIVIRDIWSDNETTDAEKVGAIKWLNEFHHRLLNCISLLKRDSKSDAIQAIYENVLHYAKQNNITKGCLGWIVFTAFSRASK